MLIWRTAILDSFGREGSFYSGSYVWLLGCESLVIIMHIKGGD